MSPELSGSATATGAERSGLRLCVCVCVCLRVCGKGGQWTEAASWDGLGWRRQPRAPQPSPLPMSEMIR